jgi:hypothetical protein
LEGPLQTGNVGKKAQADYSKLTTPELIATAIAHCQHRDRDRDGSWSDVHRLLTFIKSQGGF